MANVKVLIVVEGADPPTAVELIKTVGFKIKADLADHQVTIKVQVHCERCGDLMVVKDKHLVCDPCLKDEAQERALDYIQESAMFRLPAFQPVEQAEAMF